MGRGNGCGVRRTNHFINYIFDAIKRHVFSTTPLDLNGRLLKKGIIRKIAMVAKYLIAENLAKVPWRPIRARLVR